MISVLILLAVILITEKIVTGLINVVKSDKALLLFHKKTSLISSSHAMSFNNGVVITIFNCAHAWYATFDELHGKK